MKTSKQLLPQTIDEVITELESILEDCTRTSNRAGFFAALYHKVTCRVKDGIANNEFEDGARMERLDVLFANRYIEAYHLWKDGGRPTASWQVAFDATKSRNKLLLQHLLLGINAHINLDLGIATVETLQDKEMNTMLSDFNGINTILASLSYGVMNDITKMSPLLSFLGFHASGNNSILVQFTINNARDGAWMFANELYSKKGSDEVDECIATRDKTIAQLANGLTQPKGVLRFTTWLIHLFEWKKVANIIHELRYYRKTYIHVNKPVS
ncbi:MAG: hypothetical protein H6550_14390 [Chitinophagales bacterium]|nr:hypothetical protein [Chitinophagales bacterium]